MYDVTLASLVAPAAIAENAAATVIDSTLTIGGSTTSLTDSVVTISTTGGVDDNLSIKHTGTAAGQIGFNNGVVTYGGTAIGTVLGSQYNGFDGTDLKIKLNSAATQTSLEVMLENVTYFNDSNAPTANRTVTYTLTDSVGSNYFSQGVNVAVTSANDTPSVSWNNGARISNGATVTITNMDLNTRDYETTSTGITYTVTTAATNGTLKRNGVALVLNSTFTQADVDSGLITYTNTTANNSGSFGFKVSDGTASVTGQTFNITIDNTDAAPSIQPGTAITNLGSVSYSAATGNYYLYVGTSVNYYTALEIASKTYLNGVAGHLLTVTSSAENAFVTGIIGNSVWLGATDRNIEGEWRWEVGPEAGSIFYEGVSGSGGTTVNSGYANWATGEANNVSGATTVNVDAAALSVTSGTWTDRA